MRVLVIAQAFKETLPAPIVASAMESGVRAAGAQAVALVASDGGDGLMDALSGLFLRQTSHRVTGPLGIPLQVNVGWIGSHRALVESRLVCGLSLLRSGDRDPARTTTRGVGELVRQLEESGAGEVIIGLGGSATMDAGLGMARAWGWKPMDADGRELADGGGALGHLERMDGGRPPTTRILGLVDVQNPLTGSGGARVYAAQKGASPEAADMLAKGLENLVRVAGDSAAAHARAPGAGAAGGLGFGILHFARGSLVAGARWILDQLGFETLLREADLVVCTEGSFDATSLQGKLTGVVLEAARERGIPAGIVAPRADGVPQGVLVETGGGTWTATDLAEHTRTLVQRALRTLPAV